MRNEGATISTGPGTSKEKQTDGKRWENEIDEMYTNLNEEDEDDDDDEDEEGEEEDEEDEEE